MGSPVMVDDNVSSCIGISEILDMFLRVFLFFSSFNFLDILGQRKLGRCASITTGEDGPIPRCKPFKYTYEKEIVMYAYFKKLDYFSTECIYSPNAYSGFAREFIKDLERIRSRAILDIIKSDENFRISTSTKMPEQGTFERCGYISSQKWCKACVLLDGMNRGLLKLGFGRTKGNDDPQKEKLINGIKNMQSKPSGTFDF
ncbi:hypothetical protein GIB67_015786 [Kingdonia uniflora]|uniref:Cytoplasmic tRNA 2-thiolation protein 1 C-terminal domain-containing protein n=1 Tax=Kingdonia uniflora TaxID=39325 RepID=A0A7J7NV51_9MAGN|nr:hypothetical protein GIB67_015786 [Kingdonia uniflora]